MATGWPFTTASSTLRHFAESSISQLAAIALMGGQIEGMPACGHGVSAAI
jgi:hypothetical protein